MFALGKSQARAGISDDDDDDSSNVDAGGDRHPKPKKPQLNG